MFQGAPFLSRLRVAVTPSHLARDGPAEASQRRALRGSPVGAATVKFMGRSYDEFYHVLRWYDNVWVQ